MSGAASADTPAETVEQALTRAQAALRGKRLGEAAGICEDVLILSPEHAGALGILGSIATQKGEIERAIGLFERACAKNPTDAAWHNNLCVVYRRANRIEEAIRSGQVSIRTDPPNPTYLVNLALALIDARAFDQAHACLLRAIGLEPKHASAHLALGEALLAGGEFLPGWLEYEWRNETEQARGTLPRITSAPWNGMRIPGGRLLLLGDQGFGDTIQFARYIPIAAERCAEVILGCSPELAPLLAAIPGVAQCHTRWTDIPPHAAYARLSSLPGLFGTVEATIPASVPYLRADPAKVARWAERLGPRRGRRVGLAWAGRSTHPNDARRTIALETLAPIWDLPGLEPVSLQKPVPAADAGARALFSLRTEELLADFGETAALIANLDLVVTVDTAIGHLAGALGAPAWILIPATADWRWLRDRADSPWYPSVRLFRQTALGCWEEPVRALAAALRALPETAAAAICPASAGV